MIPVLPVALMLGPLSLYFALLGLRQAGRHPKVVSGPLDSALLGFALGALLAFGPVGRALTAGLKAPLVGPTLLCGLGVWLMAISARSRRKVVVYNVDPARLDRAMCQILDALPGDFTRTLKGFEDRKRGRGLTVEVQPRYRTAEIVAFGATPEALVAQIEPALRQELKGETSPRNTALSRFWWSLASLTLTVPIAASLLSGPRMRATVRALLDRLWGG